MEQASFLQVIWFLLIGVLFTGYAILDGFDLGVGVLSLFAKGDRERRIHLNAIGPVWDGNEVWLLTGTGALFAAFPVVYATVLSGFYLAIMLLLVALIFRAVSMEFRGKVESPAWRSVWDWCFGLGSLVAALLFGVAFGNILRGVPLAADGAYLGNFFTLLNPFSIVVGLLSLVLFVMHGALYMRTKVEGELLDRITGWASKSWFAVVGLYVVATLLGIFSAKFLFAGLLANAVFWLLFIILMVSIVYIPFAINQRKPLTAFLASSLVILCMLGLGGVSLFPMIVPSSIDLAYSLTITNASSTPRALTTMLIIALIGMPLVIAYTWYIYRVFKGKVEIGPESY